MLGTVIMLHTNCIKTVNQSSYIVDIVHLKETYYNQSIENKVHHKKCLNNGL